MGQAHEVGTSGLFSCPLLTRCSDLLLSFLNVNIWIELMRGIRNTILLFVYDVSFRVIFAVEDKRK